MGWFVYDGLSRLLEGHDRLLAVAIALVIVVTAFGVSQLLSPRASYLQVGAMIGTWMAANVLFVIIPGQQELVAAKAAGREPDPLYGIRGKQRSIHNNYLTLPVLFAMLSNHFPFTYGHAQGWLILLVLMGLGAWVRHFFNLRNQGRVFWAIPASAAIVVVLLAIAIYSARYREQQLDGDVRSGAVRLSISAALPCHSATAPAGGLHRAPNGVMFDTPEEITGRAPQIYQQAVVTRNMPFGNLTNITQAERDTLGAWYQSGAAGSVNSLDLKQFDSGVHAPRFLAAARAVVVVVFAATVDCDAHGKLVTDRLQMVVAELRAQDEVAGAGADRLGLAFDVPVDLAAHDHPPLVVLVIVGVVERAGRMEDDERLNVVAQMQRRRPRSILGGVAGQEVVQAGV